jgi:hypothetical protein
MPSTGYFAVYGVRLLHGRDFTEDDMKAGAEPVAIVSHAFWQKYFAGDPAAVGRPLHLADATPVIVGVLPPDFTLASAVHVRCGSDRQPPAGAAVSSGRKAESRRHDRPRAPSSGRSRGSWPGPRNAHGAECRSSRIRNGPRDTRVRRRVLARPCVRAADRRVNVAGRCSARGATRGHGSARISSTPAGGGSSGSC